MLRFFVKAFADHQKYSRLNRDNLKQPAQTQLSQKKKKKKKILSIFFYSFEI